MTMDSTTSELVQDNSSTECVSPETNPIATVQNEELIFGQKHNDIDCALCPTAKRACDRAWVTAKQIENWSGMSTTTLWRRLKKLDEVGRICSFSDLKNCKMPTNNGGYQDVQLYNLTENASLNPKHMSQTKNENPLLQHTKARGFLFVVGKFTGAWMYLRRQIL